MSARFFTPLAVIMSADGAEYCVRDYAGQSGRFCIIGPYTTDILWSCRSLAEAKAWIERRVGEGAWEAKR